MAGENSQFGDGDERTLRQEQNMSSDDDDASFLQQKHVTKATMENPDAYVTNAEGYEPETVNKLSHVQNDSSKSLNTDSAYGSTNQGQVYNHSNSIPIGNTDTILSANEEEDHLLDSSLANSSIMSQRSGRKSIARGVSRSNSVHYSVCGAT